MNAHTYVGLRSSGSHSHICDHDKANFSRRPLRLAAVAVLVAMMLWMDVQTAGARDAWAVGIQTAFAARVSARARDIEQEWRRGRARILAMIQSEDARGLAEIMLAPRTARMAPAHFQGYFDLLRAVVAKDRPCPGSIACEPAHLLQQSTITGKSFARCVYDHVDSRLDDAIADLRKLAAKIKTSSSLDGLDYGPLSITIGPSECAHRVSERITLGGSLNVDWGKRCTLDVQEKLYQPAVASILYEDKKRGLQSYCTGTLIAPNAVLTAAHCICATQARGDPNGAFYASAANCANGAYWYRGQQVSPMDPALLAVYFQHSGIHEVERVVLHEQYSWLSSLPRADLALLILKKPVTGIEPATVDTLGAARQPAIGQSVGFGWSTPLDSQGRPTSADAVQEQTGIKFVAQVAPTACYTVEAWHKLICWDYRTAIGTTKGGSTCHGDSGGPLFMSVGKTSYLAGVTTAGSGCLPGARAYSVEVFQFHRWIAQAVAAFPAKSAAAARGKADQVGCVFCPFCGDRQRDVFGFQDLVEDEQNPGNGTGGLVSINGKKAKLLQVAANCTPDVLPWRIGLQRKNKDGAFEDQAVCPGERVTTVAACEAKVKEGETWMIEIKGKPTRDCQIVATTFE